MSTIPPPPPSGMPTGSPGYSSTPLTPSAPLGSGVPVDAGKVRPSVLWPILGVLAMVAGVIVGGVVSVKGILDTTKKLTDCSDCQIADAGTYELTPSDTGEFVLYVDGTSDVAEARDEYRALDVSITDPDGDDVDIERYDTDLNLSLHDVDLVAVATFQVDKTGSYQITVDDPDDSGVSLRFGSVTAKDLVRPVLIGVIVGGGMFVLGLILLIVSLVKRSRAKKRRRAAQGPPPGLTAWGTAPIAAQPAPAPTPWGTPPPPPPGTWNPPT